jgi:hypothetical protein
MWLRVHFRMPSLVRLFVVVLWVLSLAPAVQAATQEVRLQAPLTTVVRVAGDLPSGALIVRATVQVPMDAPPELGVGAFVADRHGRWFQRVLATPLHVGANDIVLAMGPDEPLVGQPHHAVWNAASAARITKAGLFFWSPSAVGTVLQVDDLVAELAAITDSVGDTPSLTALELPGMVAGTIHLVSGARYELALTPTPFPSNPYDPSEFSLDAVFTHADGRTMRVPGFACEPMLLSDRGDREQANADGVLRFHVRWRPPFAGAWSGRLEARWHGGEPLTVALPPIVVDGGDHDDVVRIDADDQRFFSVDGKWFWPIGMNLHSTFDVRSRDRLSTVLTPARGSLAYADRFRRLAAAGGNATEIWMGSWNLALEWNASWPGYAGVGRYSQENAARLDAVLDAAFANGIRINLVINNHGQASPDNDREWKDHPWNRVNGGVLSDPYELFTDARSLAGQANLRRYLVARFADHPAILGWKLWSEINLTAVGDSGRRSRAVAGAAPVSTAQRLATLVSWHDGAAAHLHATDPYRHPVTTHWSGDYRKPNPEVCALPGMDYLCIDAYHSGQAFYRGSTLVDLIWNGTQDPIRGLGRFKKPVLVTEFGGSSGGTTSELLEAELASAPWAAALSGNAGMPFMWWFEWIDQGGHWQPFGAIAQFLAGEDLRGADARAVALNVTGDAEAWWARGWVRPGRMLGYIADHRWTGEGGEFPRRSGVAVRIGSQVAPGPCRIEWWDATTGACIGIQEYDHAGGALDLHAPEFLHHIAFKLIRATAERPTVR